mgnify:FL=1
MELSRRLTAVSDFVEEDTLADIGTDHGYVPIYLAKAGRIRHGIACDVKKGPLQKAKENIAQEGLSAVIETRLGSGFAPLQAGEAKTVVMAGMGGMLMIGLLEEAKEVLEKTKQLVLQPQLDVPAVRQALHRLGFFIEKEEMVLEEGKFYTILSAKPGQDVPYGPLDYGYGRCLMERRHPVLRQYLLWRLGQIQLVEEHLRQGTSQAAKERQAALAKEREEMTEVLGLYER